MMDFMRMQVQDISTAISRHPILTAILIWVLTCFAIRAFSRLLTRKYRGEYDMRGKTVLITGATSGMGKIIAMDMAKRNARVLLACRNFAKAESVAQEIKTATKNSNVVVKTLDLSDFESVRSCARSVMETEDKLHVLINNAGILNTKHRRTKDGCDIVMQTNHFGHFLLTLLLLDLLKKSAPSRIINVSSFGHWFSHLDLENLNNEKRSRFFYGYFAYVNSKLANILFTRELAEKLRGTGITVNSANPGGVFSNLFASKDLDILSYTVLKSGLYIIGRTAEEGAQTTVCLAVDPELENTTGKYFSNCRETSVLREANDLSAAKKLFEISERTVGQSFRLN